MASAQIVLRTTYAAITADAAIGGAQRFYAIDSNGFFSLVFIWDGTGNVMYVYTNPQGLAATDALLVGAVQISASELSIGV